MKTASNETVLIKNALRVAVMDDKRTELKDADIYIEGKEIKQVGQGLKVKAARVINAKNCVVLPGFVNTHHHLYQTLTRNLPGAQNSKLFDWLVYLYEVWKHMTPEAVYASTQLGLGELLLTGCTTSSDHLYLFPKACSGGFIDTQIEAALKIGARFHPCRGSMSRGKSNGGLPPDEVVQTEDEILKDSERLMKAYHDKAKFAMTRLVLAPCSPFSVTTELLKQTAVLAKKWDLKLHTHVAETIDEEEFCLQMHGKRPLDYMDSVGWLEGGRSWFAHCVYINESEAERMAATGTGVAHCPGSNLRLGSGIAPIRMFLDKKVPVGLAVDGSASNDSSDMLGEVRLAMLVSRVKAGVGSMSARDALWLATRGSAALLGRDDIASLEPGKAADISIFDVSALEYAGSMSDPVAALVFCGSSHRAKHVLVNGKLVVEDSRLVTVDEEKVAAKANEAAARLYQAAGV